MIEHREHPTDNTKIVTIWTAPNGAIHEFIKDKEMVAAENTFGEKWMRIFLGLPQKEELQQNYEANNKNL